jgi:hypothetical protein
MSDKMKHLIPIAYTEVSQSEFHATVGQTDCELHIQTAWDNADGYLMSWETRNRKVLGYSFGLEGNKRYFKI